MPISTVNFAGIEPIDYTQGRGDLFSHMLRTGAEGYKNMRAPEMINQEMEGKRHQNTILGAEAQYAPDKFKFANQIQEAKARYAAEQEQSEIALRRAHAHHANSQAEHGGLTGAPAEAFALELLKKRYGANSDVYNNAKKSYELANHSKEVLNANREELTKNAGKRFSTPLGKLQQERAEIEAGYMPGTMNSDNPIPLNPEAQQALLGEVDNKILKTNTDAQSRIKNIYATNIEKTVDNIKVDDLVRYGGLAGGVAKKIEQGKALVGKESEDYKKFQENMTAVEFLASQIRQFYGDSVQPEKLRELKELANPATWVNNPEVAKRKYNKAVSILKQELKTYRDAMKNPGVYYGQESNSSNEKELSSMSDAEIDAIADGPNK